MIHLKNIHSEEATDVAVFLKPNLEETGVTERNQDRHTYLQTSTSHVGDAEDLMRKENVRHLANLVVWVTDPISLSDSVKQKYVLSNMWRRVTIYMFLQMTSINI